MNGHTLHLSATVLAVGLLCGCATYVEPKNAEGMQCVQAARHYREACVQERRPEIDVCHERNRTMHAVGRAQIDRQARAGLITNQMAGAKLLSLVANQEHCNALTQHCSDEFDRYFLRCGGSIE